MDDQMKKLAEEMGGTFRRIEPRDGENMFDALTRSIRKAAEEPCAVHGEDCPEDAGILQDQMLDALDSTEALRIAKAALQGAVNRVDETNSSAVHDRLAIADVALELYDRVLAAEQRALIDNWGTSPEPEPSAFERSMERQRRAREATESLDAYQKRRAREDAEALRTTEEEALAAAQEYAASKESIPVESHRERCLNGEPTTESKESAEEYAARQEALKAAGREGDPEIS